MALVSDFDVSQSGQGGGVRGVEQHDCSALNKSQFLATHAGDFV